MGSSLWAYRSGGSLLSASRTLCTCCTCSGPCASAKATSMLTCTPESSSPSAVRYRRSSSGLAGSGRWPMCCRCRHTRWISSLLNFRTDRALRTTSTSSAISDSSRAKRAVAVCIISVSNDFCVSSPLDGACMPSRRLIWLVTPASAPSCISAKEMRAMLRASSMPECTLPSVFSLRTCIMRISPACCRTWCVENTCRMSTHCWNTAGTSSSDKAHCLGIMDFRSQFPSHTKTMSRTSSPSRRLCPFNHIISCSSASTKVGAASTCS
mmetsp:Transcript_21665/g.34385  ORF Transcript_21665/g.34385 Transcript_21665/m.34385 type:complete len:267 (+) Transcript_21665:1563-2363(+)